RLFSVVVVIVVVVCDGATGRPGSDEKSYQRTPFPRRGFRKSILVVTHCFLPFLFSRDEHHRSSPNDMRSSERMVWVEAKWNHNDPAHSDMILLQTAHDNCLSNEHFAKRYLPLRALKPRCDIALA